MTRATAKAQAPMSRSVHEVLGSLVSADTRDRVVATALLVANEDAVPEEAERARAFTEGPLRAAVEALVSREVAGAVIEGLDPILQMAGSHVRPRSPAPELPATVPPPQRVSGEEVVIMATLDRASVTGMARVLAGRATVHQATDIFELMSAMEAHARNALRIILDCSLPAVDPASVAGMFPVCPKGTHIILWGASRTAREALVKDLPGTRNWIECGEQTTYEDVAELLKAL